MVVGDTHLTEIFALRLPLTLTPILTPALTLTPILTLTLTVPHLRFSSSRGRRLPGRLFKTQCWVSSTGFFSSKFWVGPENLRCSQVPGQRSAPTQSILVLAARRIASTCLLRKGAGSLCWGSHALSENFAVKENLCPQAHGSRELGVGVGCLSLVSLGL